MDKRQIELVRHALGLPNDRNVSYRNRFVTGRGGINHATWMDLCRQGYAEKSDGEQKLDWFYVTRRGAEFVLLPGERLDPEDFPESPTP